MRSAKPHELEQNAFHIMTAQLSESELKKWFPVPFQDVDDPWAAPEPSKGALVKLEAGEYVVLDYGKESNQLIVRVPATVDPSSFLASFFREVPLLRSRILWRRPGTRLPRNLAAKQVTVASRSKRYAQSHPERQPKSEAPKRKL